MFNYTIKTKHNTLHLLEVGVHQLKAELKKLRLRHEEVVGLEVHRLA